MKDWYSEKIEKSVRDIVKNLRNKGINTFCSCGHGQWIQCEVYDETEDLKTISDVMAEMDITTYRIILFVDIKKQFPYKHIEIMFPDKNRNYYSEFRDNNEYIKLTQEK